MKIAGFGHSHIFCIRQAFKTNQSLFDELGLQLDTVWFGEADFKPFRVRDDVAGIDGYRFVAALEEAIVRVAEGADLLFLSVGGQAHNVLGLIPHPKPWDFVLPSEPELPLVPECEIIMHHIVTEAIRQQGNFVSSLWFLKTVKQLLGDNPLVQCESPPPLPSEHVKRHPNVFRDAVLSVGVNAETIRYKLWRLHSELFHEQCKALDIDYLDGPHAMLDGSKCLSDVARCHDPTHANHVYGLKVLEQLVRIKDPQFNLTGLL